MHRGRVVALALALVAAVVAAYGPALQSGFVWNDDTYLTDNPTLGDTGGLVRIWTDPKANEQYYPLVFTSFWVEKRLWGLAPFGFHLVNVLLHAGSALLLWALLRRWAVPAAWLAAATFALHPVCVESVAWVTERKNTLSLLLSLLAILAYDAWEGARAKEAVPASKGKGRKARARRAEPSWWRKPRALYAAACAAFLLALIAKTTACVVPAVVLVVIWWRRGRLRASDVRPLLPFFAAGAALAFHTAWLERTMVRAAGEEWALGLAGRAVLAGQAALFYAQKLFFPAPLAFVYPRWTVDPHDARQWVPLGVGVAALAAAWALRGRAGRGPLASLLLWGGVLVPAMGFFNVYAMRYSWVADHFAYQAAAIGAACVVGGAAGLLSRAGETVRRGAVGIGCAILALLGVLTLRQCRMYTGPESLWRDTLAKNPVCFMCETNYGNWLLESGRAAEAVPHLEAALSLRPSNVPALLNLARIEEQRGRLDAAAERLSAAHRIDPNDTFVLDNLATMHAKAGRLDEAGAEFAESLRIGASDGHIAHNGLGVVLMKMGRPADAAEHFREALRLRPDFEGARGNLERALAADPPTRRTPSR